MRVGGWYIRIDGGAADGVGAISEEPPVPVPASLPRATLVPSAPKAAPISAFDPLIVHQAAAEGVDWRLIAAIISEESGFNPNSRSDKGAYGLMQVRPIAAEAVGETHFTAPEDNIRTGVRYLRLLDEIFQAAPGNERLSLVLAAYNMGPGHVHDAQDVARRFGFDPNRWGNAVERMLPLLELPTIYTTLPNGYAKGRDTVAYVQRILDRYQRYKHQTATAPGADAEALSSLASSNG
jgi:membrane-bound lytic murein transglycosylase F